MVIDTYTAFTQFIKTHRDELLNTSWRPGQDAVADIEACLQYLSTAQDLPPEYDTKGLRQGFYGILLKAYIRSFEGALQNVQGDPTTIDEESLQKNEHIITQVFSKIADAAKAIPSNKNTDFDVLGIDRTIWDQLKSGVEEALANLRKKRSADEYRPSDRKVAFAKVVQDWFTRNSADLYQAMQKEPALVIVPGKSKLTPSEKDRFAQELATTDSFLWKPKSKTAGVLKNLPNYLTFEDIKDALEPPKRVSSKVKGAETISEGSSADEVLGMYDESEDKELDIAEDSTPKPEEKTTEKTGEGTSQAS